MQDRFVDKTLIYVSSALFEPCQTQFYSGSSKVDNFSYLSSKFYPLDKVSWEVQFSNVGDSVLLICGKAEVRLKTLCVRCLNDACIHVKGDIEGFIKIKDSAKLPCDADLDECLFIQKDKTVDISSLIESSILLELPPNPLCSSECRGLFEYCDRDVFGKVLEKSPFEVLKNYKF